MDKLNQLVRKPNDLISFFDISNPTPMQKKSINKGVFVTTGVRRDFLVSENQGVVLANHRHHRIVFENKSGGVWLAKLEPEL